jgi:hypothetical protein
MIMLYNIAVEIRSSALKHGCSSEDVLHAITNALAAYDDLDDPYVLYLGPDSHGSILEVMTAVDERGEEIAFHPMRMRRKYRRLLP